MWTFFCWILTLFVLLYVFINAIWWLKPLGKKFGQCESAEIANAYVCYTRQSLDDCQLKIKMMISWWYSKFCIETNFIVSELGFYFLIIFLCSPQMGEKWAFFFLYNMEKCVFVIFDFYPLAQNILNCIVIGHHGNANNGNDLKQKYSFNIIIIVCDVEADRPTQLNNVVQ